MSALGSVLVDAGPLVAVINSADEYHAWAHEQFGALEPPLHTCEAVLSEAQLLVNRRGGNALHILEMVNRGVLAVSFQLEREVERVLRLQRAYRNLPMSLADACLVRMAELHERARVFTLDKHFRIYRRNGRQLIPLLAPDGI